jgi:hypothetical protein
MNDHSTSDKIERALEKRKSSSEITQLDRVESCVAATAREMQELRSEFADFKLRMELRLNDGDHKMNDGSKEIMRVAESAAETRKLLLCFCGLIILSALGFIGNAVLKADKYDPTHSNASKP